MIVALIVNPFDPAWHLVDAIQNEKKILRSVVFLHDEYHMMCFKEGGSK